MWNYFSYISNWGGSIWVNFLLVYAFEIYELMFFYLLFSLFCRFCWFCWKLLFIKKVYRAEKINVIVLQIIGALTSKQCKNAHWSTFQLQSSMTPLCPSYVKWDSHWRPAGKRSTTLGTLESMLPWTGSWAIWMTQVCTAVGIYHEENPQSGHSVLTLSSFWLTADFSAPLVLPGCSSGAGTTPTESLSEEHLATIVSMGFSRDQATKALRATVRIKLHPVRDITYLICIEVELCMYRCSSHVFTMLGDSNQCFAWYTKGYIKLS